MAFDPATGQMILFGGFNAGYINDTWNWDGTTWSQLTPATSPPARGSVSMAFDPSSGQFILFGGRQLGVGPLDETWNWGIGSLDANAIATPSSQTICSGETTSIDLSADLLGSSFSWTVEQSGVTGATSGSGLSISQNLTATGQASGTATYTVTPTSFEGCSGSPIIVVITVEQCTTEVSPPTHFRGKIEYRFTCSIECEHLLSWRPSPDQNVIGYKIFQGDVLIKTIYGRNRSKIKLRHRKIFKPFHYEIVAFTASGAESLPEELTLKIFDEHFLD